MRDRILLATGARALGIVFLAVAAHGQSSVEVMPAPFGGFRPRAVIDDSGVLHVVQASATQRTDLFYTRREPGAAKFSEPIPVNRTAGIVAAFDMAVGEDGRVHVLMRTNPKYSKLQAPDLSKVTFFDLKYMLYARLADDGASFEPERNLAGPTIGFEGVGTILAGPGDRVLAFWHGQLEPEFGERGRQIYRVVSTDDGRTFSEPAPIETAVEGACTCCPVTGALGEAERVFLAFRGSTDVDSTSTKDSYLLTSTDGGVTFAEVMLEPWELAGCPGSNGALVSQLAQAPGAYVAWRTRADVHFARFAPATGDRAAELAPLARSSGVNARVPVLARNARGEVLCAWVEVAGPKARGGGQLVWQLFDAEGVPSTDRVIVRGAISKGWGAATAAARLDGSFLLLHDGSAEPLADEDR